MNPIRTRLGPIGMDTIIEQLSNDLPNGWKALYNKKNNRIYYGNMITSQTQWDKPIDYTINGSHDLYLNKHEERLELFHSRGRKEFDRKHRGDYDRNDPRFNHHPSNPIFLLKRIEELEKDRDEMKNRLEVVERQKKTK